MVHRIQRSGLARTIAVVATLLVMITLVNVGSARSDAAPGPAVRGTVRIDGSGVAGATVELVRAGSRPANARVVQSATTTRSGSFELTVPATVKATDVIYLLARGGELPAAVELAAALGDTRSGKVVVNELTTVAAGYSLAQFADDGELGGAEPGLSNAAKMTRNLVDVATGRAARFLRQSPNGTDTQTFPTVNSLASIITGCATGANDCDAFLDAATDAWGTRPATTWQAMTLLPANPSGDSQGVFDQIPADPRFEPVLDGAPGAWIVALRFYGNGRQFNGPGNVAFDEQGRVWANNNAEWSRRPKAVCPGLEMFRLDPFAPGRPMETFRGGGLNGAGFGIALDPDQNIWVGNFGFTGRLCTTAPTSNSVSRFGPDGLPRSGEFGYTDGPLSWPQGTKSDTEGNIWIGSCGNNSLVKYPRGDQNRAQVVASDISRAFDVAENRAGTIFVTANGNDEVFAFRKNGVQMPRSPLGEGTDMFSKPLGVASDSLGNVWVSNSGVITIPCDPTETLEVPGPDAVLEGSIVQVGATGSLAQFDGGGLTIPWGIAVDGDDNVWVANFSGERLSHFCGARKSTCPTGAAGTALSPETGYGFDGLQRNTGVQVDPSGNVWLTNNWIKFPVQIDPFGDGLVVYLGMAAPVRAPLIGTPKQP